MRKRSNRNCLRHIACYSINIPSHIEVSRLIQSVSPQQKSVISIFVKPNLTSLYYLYVAVLPTALTHVTRHRRPGALYSTCLQNLHNVQPRWVSGDYNLWGYLVSVLCSLLASTLISHTETTYMMVLQPRFWVVNVNIRFKFPCSQKMVWNKRNVHINVVVTVRCCVGSKLVQDITETVLLKLFTYLEPHLFFCSVYTTWPNLTKFFTKSCRWVSLYTWKPDFEKLVPSGKKQHVIL